MARLIDADRLLMDVDVYARCEDESSQCELHYDEVVRLIKRTPTVNAITIPQAESLKESECLEPMKISMALQSEVMALTIRQRERPKDVSPLDYTVIYALKKLLEMEVQENEPDA